MDFGVRNGRKKVNFFQKKGLTDIFFVPSIHVRKEVMCNGKAKKSKEKSETENSQEENQEESQEENQEESQKESQEES